MINYDFELRMSFNSIEPSESTRERILRARDVDMTKKMQNVMKFTKRKLIKTQEYQKMNANKKRASASDYKDVKPR
jgi:hypothetical protein